MNLKEYLYTKLNEELGETSKPVSKALTFGLYDINPHTGNRNLEEIQQEFTDVLVIIYLLKCFGVDLELFKHEIKPALEEYYLNKINKVIYYTFVSIELGCTVATTAEVEQLRTIQLEARQEITSRGGNYVNYE